jgi:hypothetical protein
MVDFDYEPTGIYLADNGGFADLDLQYSDDNWTNVQSDPDLRGRAYLVAWLNNFYAMDYFNVDTKTDARQPLGGRGITRAQR